MNVSMNLAVKMPFVPTLLAVSCAHVNLILPEIHTKAVLILMNAQH